MVETYAAYADEGLEILGVLHDDTVEGGRAFAADQGATWPMLYDADDEAWDAYLGVGKPTSFFVDPDGVVQSFSLGPFNEQGLQRQLATIIPEARKSVIDGAAHMLNMEKPARFNQAVLDFLAERG